MARKPSRKRIPKRKSRKRKSGYQFGLGKWDRKPTGAILLILIAVFIAFYPSLNNDFVNWDDDRNFYENPLIVNITAENFWQYAVQIFQTPVIGNYNPLSILTFAVEKILFGLDQPFYWHLDNLILHGVCVFLTFRIGMALGLNLAAASLLALLFGLHPMRVESVAWLTERKDVLFGSFYLGALLVYIRYHQSRKTSGKLILIYGLFIFSLFSKIQAVALPLSLLCIDYLIGRRLKWSLITEKLPYLGISLVFGILGIIMLQSHGSLESNVTYPVYVRPFVGTYSFLIYLIKSVVPYQLIPLYPYPNKVPWYFYASAATIPIYIWLIYAAWKKEAKELLFGFAFFTVNIIFLLQILGAGQGFLADRFTYISYLGLFFIYAHYFQVFLNKYRNQRIYIYSVVGLLLLFYGYLTYQQCKIWKNGETLWTHVLDHFQNITLPYGNRANYYRDVGQFKKALEDYNQLIRLKPDKAGSYNSRAKLYFNSNNRDTLQLALTDYNRAIDLDPGNGEYYINRGAAFARLNRLQEALSDLNNGIKLDPSRENGYLNRSVVYNMMGNLEAAIADMDKYLEFKPFLSDVHYERGRANFKLGNLNEALIDFNRAIDLNPNKGIYFRERAVVYSHLGQMENARSDARNAIRFNTQPDPAFLQQIELN